MYVLLSLCCAWKKFWKLLSEGSLSTLVILLGASSVVSK
jgi:hypothetical protein